MNTNTEPASSAPAKAPATFYNADSYVAGGDSVAHLVARVFNAFHQDLERRFEPSGLTNAQWKPLFKLSTGEVSTVAELARVCTLDAGGMTRMLDRLEAKGLCQRERSSEDRRVVKLALTDAGREAAKVVPQVLSEVQNAYLAGFSVEEWHTLKDLLRRLLDNANQQPSA
ncbi:MarR family transcriptional regulator [Rhodoferax koreense]|uniref:MarR family transcriptional regulator n=1 Tax=Rhodoferax koreensis TaxID=1842727 RepID=A0A1P8JY96_9BURK|nr:MarR family transcriptional regulator [Rhodoferax koreense]APW38726.1 MarR family transcriptional regulator [Rhodoferax koreense]